VRWSLSTHRIEAADYPAFRRWLGEVSTATTSINEGVSHAP